jgi:nitrate reductase (cytochrome), electron transfer subunit
MNALTKSIATIILLLVGTATLVQAAQNFSAERGYSVTEEKTPAPLAKPTNTDIKAARDYPMAAPTIPHDITGYVIDKNGNKCLSCHKRTRIGDTQAPMISVTHFIDRNNEFLADVAPRRYFCTQCHVERTDAKPIVGNGFIDVEQLINSAKPAH